MSSLNAGYTVISKLILDEDRELLIGGFYSGEIKV